MRGALVNNTDVPTTAEAQPIPSKVLPFETCPRPGTILKTPAKSGATFASAVLVIKVNIKKNTFIKITLVFYNGDNRLNLEELKNPSLVRVNYELIWMKRKIDLRELAKLRESGLSLREIQKITGVGKTTVARGLMEFYENKLRKS